MVHAEVANALLLITISICSFRAFGDLRFKDICVFEPYRVIEFKEYHRMVACAFVHSDIYHLIFNCFSLYSFGRNIEIIFGAHFFLIIFFSSVLGGSVLSLFLHRNHTYTALGASGGVCGVIFSSIFLLPGGSIAIFPLPIPIPSAIYAILFLAVSIYGIRTHYDRIGHDAHLGGAIIGLIATTIMAPGIIRHNLIVFLVVIGLSLGFLYYLYNTRGLNLPFFFPKFPGLAIQKQNIVKSGREMNMKRSVDDILGKISERGIENLSVKEKEILLQASKKMKEVK